MNVTISGVSPQEKANWQKLAKYHKRTLSSQMAASLNTDYEELERSLN